jgi:wobble nucleotide-excising tRNase
VGISHLSVPDLDITSIQTKINNIIGKTVISKVIQKLKEDTEIAKWVEKGLNLHKDKALNKCAFCDQMIPLDRLNDLAQHFNEGYRHIVNAIQELKRECNSRRITIGYPEAITLYEELSQEYLKAKNSAEQTTVAFNNTLDSFISILEQKEQNAFLELKPITCDQLDNTPFTTINKIIDRHNEKTNNFELRIKNDKKDLELHHISQFLSLHDEKGLQSYKTASENSDQALKAKEKEIEQLKTTMLSHKIAVEQINKDLKHFLGRDDLQIKGLDTPGGYQVSRNGKAACNLS